MISILIDVSPDPDTTVVKKTSTTGYNFSHLSAVWGCCVLFEYLDLTAALWDSCHQYTWWQVLGWGLLKQVPLSVIFRSFHNLLNIVNFKLSHSYLTGVTTAELWWHLSNMNMIQRMYHVILQKKRYISLMVKLIDFTQVTPFLGRLWRDFQAKLFNFEWSKSMQNKACRLKISYNFDVSTAKFHYNMV